MISDYDRRYLVANWTNKDKHNSSGPMETDNKQKVNWNERG